MKRFPAFLLCFWSWSLFALSPSDSLSRFSRMIEFAKEKDLLTANPQLQHLDTSLLFFHQYIPQFKEGVYHNYLGYFGSPSISLMPSPLLPNGHFSGLNKYGLYEYRPEDMNVFRARKRFTELYYVLGSNRTQILEIVHSQNINKYFNFGLNFRRYTTQSFMDYQNTYGSNLGGFIWYHTPRNRYNILVNGIYNNIEGEENGGIASPTEFSQFTGLKLTFPTLQKDSSYQRSKFLHVTQVLNFSNDSLNVSPYFRLKSSADLESRNYVYKDTTITSFWQTAYLNPLRTFDSSSTTRYTFDFKLEYLTPGKGKWSIGLKEDILRVFQYVKKTDYSTLSALAQFDQKVADLQVLGNFEYGVQGNNAGNYLAEAGLGWMSKRVRPVVKVFSQIQNPYWFYNGYVSNHYVWFNDFSRIKTHGISGEIKDSALSVALGASYSNISNSIVFNTDAVPAQINAYDLGQIWASKNFKTRKLYFLNKVIFQKSSSSDIRLPGLMANQIFMYEDKIFKKALKFGLGYELRYYSSYSPYAYTSATGFNYIQSFYKSNDLILLDLFLNIKVKTARIFVKVENLLGNVSGENVQYMTPYYPLQARVFRLGLSWRFFD